MLRTDVLLARAKAGANFLDEQAPGWVESLTETIRVGNTNQCPLAQLYGKYKIGFKALGLTDKRALHLGFRSDASECGFDHEMTKRYYSLLDQYWGREVAARRNAS